MLLFVCLFVVVFKNGLFNVCQVEFHINRSGGELELAMVQGQIL